MRSEDRRAAGTTRVPFDVLVEVGGQLGPAFEAQAMDISEEGMHLRTAYLPEAGQALVFRFDAGPGRQLVAGAEVIWKREEGRGGEFGVRFTDLDGESVAALGRILGLGGPDPSRRQARVRLHIEGLASPMRARVKQATATEMTAFSELGFLQVGKQLELEDGATGERRPACIERVDVELDESSRVPQLIVRLRFDDVPVHALHQEEANAAHPAKEAQDTPADAMDTAPEESVPLSGPRGHHGEPPAAAPSRPSMHDAAIEEAAQMRGAIARGAQKVGPAMAAMMNRAKVTLALLAARHRAGAKDEALPVRRTTAPPPGGALHAAGRKVVRSEPEGEPAMDPAVHKPLFTKRRIVAGGAVSTAVLLAFFAMRKPAADAPLANTPPAETAATAAPATSATPPAPAAETPAPPPASTMADLSSQQAPSQDEAEPRPKKIHVAPFSNGPVSHGNVLRLKMDGAIDKIEGASQPTGFMVRIPGHRSLEPAGPLAARDGRIASIRVSNEANGAELSLAFKDGVPNYLVRAKGDTLEIVLAPIGRVTDDKPATHSAQAKHTEAGAKPHGKSHKRAPRE